MGETRGGDVGDGSTGVFIPKIYQTVNTCVFHFSVWKLLLNKHLSKSL